MTNPPSPAALEFDRFYAAEQLRRSRHPFRRFVKGFYLRHILRDVAVGSCIDFGCGAGLTVYQAQAEMQDFELAGFAEGHFRSLVIAHVLEHLPDPVAALRVLLAACRRLGVKPYRSTQLI